MWLRRWKWIILTDWQGRIQLPCVVKHYFVLEIFEDLEKRFLHLTYIICTVVSTLQWYFRDVTYFFLWLIWVRAPCPSLILWTGLDGPSLLQDLFLSRNFWECPAPGAIFYFFLVQREFFSYARVLQTPTLCSIFLVGFCPSRGSLMVLGS